MSSITAAACRRRARTLRRTPLCPGLTRAWALGWARAWNVVGLDLTDFEMDVSELATNAVLHAAGDEITVRLSLRPDSLRFAVVDWDPRRLSLPSGGLDGLAEGGRGLLIVRATSDAVGCRLYRDRKSVFAVWGLPVGGAR
jgi:anti-sigma regulatory factor (Ser/Thr protein kinase)